MINPTTWVSQVSFPQEIASVALNYVWILQTDEITFQGIHLHNRQICKNVTVSFEHLTFIPHVQKGVVFVEIITWFLSVRSDIPNCN